MVVFSSVTRDRSVLLWSKSMFVLSIHRSLLWMYCARVFSRSTTGKDNKINMADGLLTN